MRVGLLGGVAASVMCAAVAGATPVVTFKAKPVPIPGYPHTGFILGAGAALEAEYTISGTEYGGFPPPLTGIDFYLPAGVVLHPQGFPTCPASTLEHIGLGPMGCPRGSVAGPPGEATGYVAFGTEIVPETVKIEPFYAPGGGLEFFSFGHSPVLLEILSKGRYVAAAPPFGKKLEAEIPLVETVPGAQDASVETIKVRVGSAITVKGKPVFYGRLPSRCPPSHDLPVRTEVHFAGVGGLAPQTVTVEYRAPCPRR